MLRNAPLQRYRTPSRSRSRSATPIHWKKEESRVIKLSEFERAESDRKKREEKRERMRRDSFVERNISSDRKSYTPEPTHKEVDYNALDYEDNQSEEDSEIPKKQVPSLVQYPLLTTFNADKPKDKVPGKEAEAPEEEMVQNSRSEVLALALGVQIKTGEDPPQPEPAVHDKKVKRPEVNSQLNAKLYKLAGQENPKFEPQTNEKQEDRGGRNKFEREKPEAGYEKRVSRNGRSFAPERRRGRYDSRRPPARSSFSRRDYRSDRRDRDRDRDRERRRRSPRRSRSRDRRRSRSRKSHSNTESKRRTRTISKDKVRDRSRSKDKVRNRSKSLEKAKKTVEEKVREFDKAEAEEKYTKLLILRKQMELLELKKKQEIDEVSTIT